MPSSHVPARVVESVLSVLLRARGQVLTPDLADAIGAAVASQYSDVEPHEIAGFLKRQHIGAELTEDLARERANNIAMFIVVCSEVAA